ncbi:glucan endo-1,3-beta-D-glucosidase-like [Cucurbita maxima]|uniref:Glucan endo-1,3-beta-D-glucosidase-like n=1 Tax=Cucurbita maxima TaxID=3661 RepID=A0A6J1II46_CUCMA|nr:glucan endo-1,3-beta-D-glucosidase-like [Cucurbita maxima]
MAKAAALCFLFLLSFISGGDLLAVNGLVNATLPNQKTWCLPKPSSDQATLLGNIDFACSKVDCKIIQEGGSCFDPDTLFNHASVAMSLYYNAEGDDQWNCDFRGSGVIVITNPSYENCIYP